jgi:Fic family protein
MRIPKTPPKIEELTKEESSTYIENLFSDVFSSTIDNKYLHWDKLKYYEAPAGLSHKVWWFVIKVARQSLYKQMPLKDKQGQNFRYAIIDSITKSLHEIDKGAAGQILMDSSAINSENRDRYLISSLVNEAITSSQIEGAATTREVAKEMLKSGRAPRDKSEQMILNNFKTMQQIRKLKDKPLTKEIVFDIHRMVTEHTLDKPDAAGQFRLEDEKIRVVDDYNNVFHEPPAASELEHRMQLFCDFANCKIPEAFVHPVIRSIILHFWLAYDHPFIDGNGRTARALFYWSMMNHGYWMFEYISISEIILNASSKYERAFLYTETDDNDLTYFILYHLDVIDKAVQSLHKYIKTKSEQLRAVEQQLRGMQTLNHRQQALISHALRHPGFRYTVNSHKVSHNIAYETARTDLLELVKQELLVSLKVGRTMYFIPAKDLEKKLTKP